MNIVPQDLLDSIEVEAHQVVLSQKTGGVALQVHLDKMLDLLDNLIQLSADRFMELEAPGISFEEQDYKQYIIHPDDIIKAKTLASHLLLRVISSNILVQDDKDDDRMDRSSRLLAHMSGRGAAGAITRTWHIPYLNENGVKEELPVLLHEPCYVGNDLGFKTWGAAPLMAKKLIQENCIPHLADSQVLELGTGTGMVGLVCDHLGAAEIHVTDYHPRVLENVAHNIILNNSHAQVTPLDFIKVSRGEAPEWEGRQFDIVIASDLLYEMEHADHLPVAVSKLMRKEFYFMIPLRSTHWEEVNHFEQKMVSLGFILRKTVDSERVEEEGTVAYRYYEYTK